MFVLGELETAWGDIILNSCIQFGLKFPSHSIHMYSLHIHAHLFSVLYTAASVIHEHKQMGEEKQSPRAALVIACPLGAPRNLPFLEILEISLLLHLWIWLKTSNESGSITLVNLFLSPSNNEMYFVLSEFWIHTSSKTFFYIKISVLALSLQNNSSGYSTWCCTIGERYFMIGAQWQLCFRCCCRDLHWKQPEEWLGDVYSASRSDITGIDLSKT